MASGANVRNPPATDWDIELLLWQSGLTQANFLHGDFQKIYASTAPWLWWILAKVKMTVNEARKVLGRDAQDMSDEEVQTHIETATLLKDLFFSPKVYAFVSDYQVASALESRDNE